MSQPRDDGKAARSLAALMELVARLRAPDGCPWDRQQTSQSSIPYLLEEAFEAADALESGDPEKACSELGDLLFQVVFQAQIHAEAGQFTLGDVIRQVHQKMTRRHPHVFGQETAADCDEVMRIWGREKRREDHLSGQGLLDSVPAGAPALMRAQRLGKKAAGVGLDWTGPDRVWDKVREELGELKAAQGRDRVQSELGDLLFALVQWARHQKIDAEAALRGSNQRFCRRVGHMERSAAAKGVKLQDLSAAELDELWEAAKAKSPPEAD